MAVNRTPGRTPSRPLAFINAGLYLTCVTVGGFLVAGSARTLLLFFREPIAYLPDLNRAFWLVGIELLLALLGALAVGRALSGQRPSWRLSVGVYGLLSLLLAYWTVGLPREVRASPLHPRATVLQHLNTLAGSLKAHHLREGRYPELIEALEGAPTGASPWTTRGQRLDFLLVSERGLGARLAGREGDLAGTFYYVVSPTRDHYWLTAVVLDGAPTGHLDFLRDEKTHPVILSSHSPSRKDENRPLLTPGGSR